MTYWNWSYFSPLCSTGSSREAWCFKTTLTQFISNQFQSLLSLYIIRKSRQLSDVHFCQSLLVEEWRNCPYSFPVWQVEVFWISRLMFSEWFSRLRGFLMQTWFLRWPCKKESQGHRFGDRGGHSISRRYEFWSPGKCYFKNLLFILWYRKLPHLNEINLNWGRYIASLALQRNNQATWWGN